MYRETEKRHCKTIIKSVWITKTFYLEDDTHREVIFNGETPNFYFTVFENLFSDFFAN